MVLGNVFCLFILYRKELTRADLRLSSLEKPARIFGPWLTSGNMAFETFPKWWSYIWIEHLLFFWESGILVVVVRKKMHICPASIKTLNSWILIFCAFLTEILYTHGCIFAAGGSVHSEPSWEGENRASLQMGFSSFCLLCLSATLGWLCVPTMLMWWFLAMTATLILVTWVLLANHWTLVGGLGDP